VTEARIQKVQEEKEKAIEALKQEKDEALEQLRVEWYNVTTYESEREDFGAMLLEENAQLQKDKEKFLTEWATVKDVLSKACLSMLGLA
jgi:hypothetical protein